MRKQSFNRRKLGYVMLAPMALIIGVGCGNKEDKPADTFKEGGSGYYSGPMKAKDAGAKKSDGAKGAGEP